MHSKQSTVITLNNNNKLLVRIGEELKWCVDKRMCVCIEQVAWKQVKDDQHLIGKL